MRKSRIGASLLLAAGLTLVPAVAAQAVPSPGTDPSNDVPGLPANADIISLSVNNTLANVTSGVTMRAALPAANDPAWENNGGNRAVTIAITPNDDVYSGYAFSYGGGPSAGVYTFDADTEETEGGALCPATVNISGATLNFSAAASCLGTPATVDAFAFSYVGDDGDFAIVDDNNLNSDFQTVRHTNPGGGYLLGADGGVFAIGDAPFHGSTGNLRLNKPVVALAKNPKANSGYWFVASDGGVFSYGPSTGYYGSRGGQALNAPIVGMAATPSGNGYYLVASDGGVFTYGDASFQGSMGGKALNRPIVGITTTAGGGYYLVASDGGVFSFGPGANFYGSTGGTKLNQPIVSIASTGTGGYYLMASDGGVFTFGNAVYRGSTATDLAGQTDVKAVAFSLDTNGYHITLDTGRVVVFGNNFNYGDINSTGIDELNQPIVGGLFNAAY